MPEVPALIARRFAEARTLSILLLIAAPGLCGCAAVPIAAAGAGSGVNYTSTTAYRSFTYSKPRVRAAALQALERMRITETKEVKDGEDTKIRGKTKHLTIYITLAPITPRLTKVSINAKRNWLMKDQTVSAEILIQMDQALELADSAH